MTGQTNYACRHTFRTSKGPPKFCIDLEADWLLILAEASGKSPNSIDSNLLGRANRPHSTQDLPKRTGIETLPITISSLTLIPLKYCTIHDCAPICVNQRFLKLQLHDAIYRLRFYSNSLIHTLSLSNSDNNVASIQKNRGDKSHRAIVALHRKSQVSLSLVIQSSRIPPIRS